MNYSGTNKTYKVFSVNVAPANTDFLQTSFKADDEYQELLTTLQEASIFSLDVHVSVDEKILTFVSGEFSVDEGRLLVHAFEIEE